MSSILIQIITILYATVSVLSLIAYWPTIKDLLHKKPSANTTSYIMWALTTGIACLYSFFVLPDFWFQAVSVLNFLACTLIALLSIRLKNR